MRTRSLVFFGTAGSCLLLALAYGLLAADRYRAVATLFIDPSPFEVGTPGMASPAKRGSELDLLRSDRVAQRVVENEGLVSAPALRSLYLQSIDAGRPPLETLTQYVAAHVEASGSDGGLVRLAVTLGDPALAAQVANAYAQAWGEVSLELRSASIRSGVERAHEELASLRARLGEARSRINGGNALAAAGSHADEQFAQLSQWSTRALEHTAGTGMGSTMGAGEALAVAATGARNSTAAAPAEVILAAHYGDAREDAAVPSSGTGTERLGGGNTDLGSADASTRRVAAPRNATSADDEIRMAQQSLERAEDRLARLSAEGIGAPFPAHVLRPAAVPEASIKPSPVICAAVGLAAGLVLGLLAALLGEMLDRRVRRSSDLTRATGIVVLGNLPAVVPMRGPGPGNWRTELPLPRSLGSVQ